ncbi:MAG: PilN domain-containing protein [Acidobacteria bacterium]|nr:PilN domain-containing protein [Acidobacteriota bacterium]
MIRINLLSGGREKARKKVPIWGAHGMTIGCSLILLAAVAAMGWRYWTVARDSRLLDAEIATAQQETTRLHSVIQQVQQFEQRKAQLQQRVVLIEQLRKDQTGPVHLLDQVSRALPPMVWLDALRQDPRQPADVLLEGRSTTLTGLSDFAGNLEATGYFKRSVEIVSTTTDRIAQPPGEIIRFQLRAIFQPPAAAPPPASPGAAGAPAAARPAT